MDYPQYKSELLSKIKTGVNASKYGAITLCYNDADDKMLYATLLDLEKESMIMFEFSKVIPANINDPLEVQRHVWMASATGEFVVRATATLWRDIHETTVLLDSLSKPDTMISG